MEQLNIPSFEYKLRKNAGKLYIYDELRKKFLVLTPEEWVRQHFVHHLINHYQYPKSLIKLESGLQYNQRQKRSDIQVYDRQGNIFMIIECKAPYIALSQAVFDQAAQYNKILQSPYLCITNGMSHACCHTNWQTQAISFLPDLPLFT